MKFEYSYKKLLIIFLSRLAPSLVFWYFALLWGDIFWVVTVLFWVEAIVEVIWWKKRAYLTLDENRIQKHLLFVTDTLKPEEVEEVFVYNNEWTFTPKDDKKMEIKIFKNYVAENQKDELEKRLNAFWEKVRELQKGKNLNP